MGRRICGGPVLVNAAYLRTKERKQGYKLGERSKLATLCYIEKKGQLSDASQSQQKHDVNKDKWIGIGGHFEENESPEECLLREAKEETGLTYILEIQGIVTFISEGWNTEYMCLYTADGYEGEIIPCNEGVLEWIRKRRPVKAEPVGRRQDLFFKTASGKRTILFPETGL